MQIQDFKLQKQQQKKITLLTCYDYPSARILAESNIDCALVGDSVATVVHGYPHTTMATMDMMVMHTQAVAKGLTHQFLVSDMPFLSYRSAREHTIRATQRLIQAGAHAVKLEGGDDEICQTVKYLVKAGVPVMGHIGLVPQSVHSLGGYRVQGKEKEQSMRLLQEAKDLEHAGCFAVVLECIPAVLAKAISEALSIPTIGIGAGAETDGQVLVWHDLLGLQTELVPRFIKHYAPSKQIMLDAINTYVEEVLQKQFPASKHTF